jgi:enediyne polyketide synthase
LERRAAELIPGWSSSVTVEPGRRTQAALRRPDGKPEGLSVSHCGGLRVAIAGPAQVSCDAEEVLPRSRELWRDLLGEDGFALAGLIAAQTGNFDLAATHVWTASECLTKVGAPPGSPLVLVQCHGNGGVLLASAARRIASFEIPTAPAKVFAFLSCP